MCVSLVKRLKEMYLNDIKSEYNRKWSEINGRIRDLKDEIFNGIVNVVKASVESKFGIPVKVEVRYTKSNGIVLFIDTSEIFRLDKDITDLEMKLGKLEKAYKEVVKRLEEWERQALLARLSKLKIEPFEFDKSVFEV